MPSKCLDRCSYYKYRLDTQPLHAYDDLFILADLYLFFSSSYVEIWSEFESYSAFKLFSDIGGAMGLLLGMSLLSVIGLVGKMIARCARRSKIRI